MGWVKKIIPAVLRPRGFFAAVFFPISVAQRSLKKRRTVAATACSRVWWSREEGEGILVRQLRWSGERRWRQKSKGSRDMQWRSVVALALADAAYSRVWWRRIVGERGS